MKKKWRWMIAISILLIIFGGSFGWHFRQKHKNQQRLANYKVPPVVISAETVKASVWHPFLAAVGTLNAVNGVNINSKVAGQIESIYFHSGTVVAKGDPLIQLSTSTAKQVVAGDKAQLQLARIEFQQQQLLYRQKAAAKSRLNEAKATFLSAKARLNQAIVGLRNHTIRAPFSGRLGISKIALGQYINPGDPLVSLQARDPLDLKFFLPEQDIQQIKIGQQVRLTVEAYPKHVFLGRVTALNSVIDQETRNIEIEATVANPDHLLYPGGFADIKLMLPQQDNVILIPQTAINYSLYGDSVYIIKKKTVGDRSVLTAEQLFVTLADRAGSAVIVTKGLKVGDQVVTAGQLKLRPGTAVVINNTVRLH